MHYSLSFGIPAPVPSQSSTSRPFPRLWRLSAAMSGSQSTPTPEIPRDGSRKPTNWATRSRRPRVRATFTEEQIISRIVGCTRRNNWYSAHVAYIQYTSRAEPTPKLIGAYVHALSRGGRIDDARAILHTSAYGDSAFARASIIAGVARKSGPDAALTELYALPPHLWSPHACTAVMHALGLHMRADDAVLLMRAAQRNGVLVDMEMYDAVLRALGRAGRVNDAYNLLGELRMRGFQPSDITFEALIYSCAHAQSGIDAPSVGVLGRRACVIYDAAASENLITPRVLSAFVSVVLRSGLWTDERVPDLIDRMQDAIQLGEEGLRKGGVTYERFLMKLERLIVLRGQNPN